MKKIIWTVLCSIISTSTFAYENLIISTSESVATIDNKSADIITIQVLTTLMNERNTILVDTKAKGNAYFTITLKTGKREEYKLNITDLKTEVIKAPKNVDIFVLDDYAKEIELDLPPGVIWNK